ncbi:peptidoglycan DD-metalloendopeptidase family protein [Jiella sp. 40Bstr34]|uniref:Peptidoglycan DD-metalloendopeptidase family protein n=1 Tax=Jiella pacifica TaxID=2696469 RepID=A0A6N9SVC6_9HYPH|nr:peptidoglycan DD-metalloendopeptidase family protein [Jiella pacifica]
MYRIAVRRALSRVGALLLACSLVPGATAASPALDETTVAAIGPAPGFVAGGANPPSASAIEARREKTTAELAVLASRIELSEATIRSLDEEIVAIAADRDKLTAALQKASDAQRKISGELQETEGRLTALGAEEDGIRASLAARRDVLAEVLAALERMGAKPPPALLVRPRDALGAVRSSILLGAVVPTMRKETQALVADLESLAAVKASIVTEKDRFAAQIKQHREEEARLDRLFEEKRKLEAANRERRRAEAARADELAGKAEDLKDLIAALQAEADAARAREIAQREAEARRLAEERRREAEARREAAAARERLALERQKESAEKAGRVVASGNEQSVDEATAEPTEPASSVPAPDTSTPATTDVASQEAAPATVAPPDGQAETGAGEAADEADAGATRLAALEEKSAPEEEYDIAALRNNTALLEPAAAFSTLKARLSKPVLGRQIIGFGEKDDIGRSSTGVSFASRAGDVVVAPADSRVLYAGIFRSYGELLILDAGDGYHIVLAGMDRIDVSSGQFVSAGEPVALMGAQRVASVQVAEFGAAEPALYVEFRKDGKPVDPSPWWTQEPSGRTRNDS